MRHLTRKRYAGVLITLGGLVLLSAAAGVLIGSTPVDVVTGMEGILRNASDPGVEGVILLRARFPRVLAGVLVGGTLAMVGAAFQAILRNPLADPYILGVSGGAALGGSCAIALGLSGTMLLMPVVPVFAFAGGLTAVGIIYLVAASPVMGGGPRGGSLSLLLTGVVFNAFAAAIIMFIKTVVTAQKAQELLFWLMGTLAVEGISYVTLLITALYSLAGCGVLLACAGALDALSLGDDDAESLGVRVRRLRALVFFFASLSVGAVVAISGLVGFVGLIVPHALRLALGADQRLLLPASFLAGGAFLCLCDLLTRGLFPLVQTEIPVGVVTALIGAPVFFVFLRRGAHRMVEGVS